jgi:lysophospholipase L1-like esterase
MFIPSHAFDVLPRIALKILLLCITASSLSAMAQKAPIEDFGDPAGPGLRAHASALQRNNDTALTIVQFGDSHTAGDYMTDALRNQLQSVWGKGAISWLAPMRPAGQRSSLVRWQSQGWSLRDSRKDEDPDFPMGGYIATPDGPGELLLEPKVPLGSFASVQILIKPLRADAAAPTLTDGEGKLHTLSLGPQNQWQLLRINGRLPYTFHAQEPQQYALGGYWVRDAVGGVTVTSIGSNGAQQLLSRKWRSNWIKQDLGNSAPDLIILAYGTNEAFNPKLDLIEMKINYLLSIGDLRQQFPKSPILILGAPDSLSKNSVINSSQCQGQRPAQLDVVQDIQRSVARELKTLYWDWQADMGGPCSMKQWQQQGLAGRDGVHFTEAGYTQIGLNLAQALRAWLDKSRAK